MLTEQLKNYDLVLASGSPRRQDFFARMGLPFRVEVKPVDEIYSLDLKGADITDYLAKKKADAFSDIGPDQIIVTSDTIVWFEDKPLEKPLDKADAKRMLMALSGKAHQVFTSVCITTDKTQKVFHDMTKVWFKNLTEAEINHYIGQESALDKAGSYGIQDWLGYIGVDRIEGCFFNVMGLPTRLVYHELNNLLADLLMRKLTP
jgi:septum formation protein